MKRFCAVLILSATLRTAMGEVLLKETFSYPNGWLVSVSGGAWQTFSGTTGQVSVAGSRASLNLANSEDVQVFLSPPPATDVLFAGFTLRFTTVPPAAGDYFVLFKDAGASAGFRARVWALTNGVPGGQYRLGLSSTTSSLNVTNPTDLSLNTDYRVVISLTNATGVATLWINPSSSSDPAVSTAEAPASSAVAALALRQGLSRGQLTLDDLVVGESFAGVVSTNPPPAAPLPSPFLSVLTYNTHGNQVADWSTNSPQVQAIGRQVQFLDPDIITFQEIPMTNNGWAKMPDFVAAYRPGFHLATNSGDDGFIRSAILSRHPITRSHSWLRFADLKPFGYTNTSTTLADNFTRDLFEAEIAVPGFAQPLHVFTTHLKSGTGSADDSAKRAAEASAVSNFFVNVFLPTNGHRPYVLTGDLNEDIARPAVGSQQPIQRLLSAPTGLRLLTPRNPQTTNHRTHSIQNPSGVSNRFDYILPGGLLFSNFAGGQVFRSDTLTSPPAPLQTNDSVVASDHLPVLAYFANPYAPPFRVLSIEATGGLLTLRWESTSNAVYGVDNTTNLAGWTTLASNLTATGTNTTFATNLGAGPQFFRVFRVP